jgi:3-oxoacyl-[acyl-carrier protein] reductase
MPTKLAETTTAAVRGRLAGKAAIITGAASGIGLATARRFVAEGARVVVADRSGADASAAAGALGSAAVPVTADVTDRDAVAAMVAAGVDAFGTIDILYNNAGIAESVKPLADISTAEWEQVLGVNLTAFFLCAQAVAPVMRAGGGGSIIVTSSIASRRPRPGMAAYVASKAGATGLARALAIELAADHIRVNVINPGPAKTPMLKQFGLVDGDDAEMARALGDALPLGAAIEPEDIAAAAVYLASDEAAKVTGLVMNVDAGRDL